MDKIVFIAASLEDILSALGDQRTINILAAVAFITLIARRIESIDALKLIRSCFYIMATCVFLYASYVIVTELSGQSLFEKTRKGCTSAAPPAQRSTSALGKKPKAWSKRDACKDK